MKQIIILILMCLSLNISNAQVDIIRQKQDSIFQHIDKTQIPTGYLKEYGAEMMPIHCYNGILHDSNWIGNIDILRSAYEDLYTSKIQNLVTTMPSLTAYNTNITTLKNDSIAPVAIIFGNYASLKPEGLSLNLVTINNQQLYDVQGRIQSPYTTNNLFAAASINNIFDKTVKLYFTNTLYISNTNITVSNIWVDFKDGLGYKLIPTSGFVSKTYADSSGLKELIYKVQLSTGALMFCHSTVVVNKVEDSNITGRYIDTDPTSKEVPVPVVMADGIGGGDVMQIRYSINNSSRNSSTPHLIKPLLLVEGYDVSNSNTILSFIKNEAEKSGEWIRLKLGTGYDFMFDLDDISSYDLVYLNYNTLRSFEDNSKMLQRALEWINADKVASSSVIKNVILGISAGGVLSRYTLARMTKNISPASTDTRLLITMDSPHQGANVPLALQHFLYDLGNVQILGRKIKDQISDFQTFYDLNNAPATAQLLRARVLDENGTIAFNTFLNGSNSAYQQMIKFAPTDPQPLYEFKAVAQGSQCGIPVLPSNNLNIANYDGLFSKLKFWLPVPISFSPPICTRIWLCKVFFKDRIKLFTRHWG